MSDATITPPAVAGGPALTEETERLAAIGRGEIDPAAPPPAPAAPETPARPDGIPEKFWDTEKGEVRTEALLKSYLELEKSKPQSQQPVSATNIPPADDPSGDPAGEGGGETPPASAPLSEDLFATASAEFATSGDLSPETRQLFQDAGIPQAYLDLYVEGVKAVSARLDAEIFELAGGEEPYKAAVDWARENWDQGKIDKFNAALADPDLRELAVQGLLNAAPAPRSEGQLTDTRGATDGGDVYHDHREFLKDLEAADNADDQLARKAAVQKLERSKKAKTLTHVTPRTGLSRLG